MKAVLFVSAPPDRLRRGIKAAEKEHGGTNHALQSTKSRRIPPSTRGTAGLTATLKQDQSRENGVEISDNMTNNQRWWPRIPATIAMYTGRGKRAAFLTVSLMLSACGGGGGGTIVPTPPPVIVTPFTSWSAVQPGATVKADGLGQEAPYRYSGSAITEIGTPFLSKDYSTLLTFNAATALTSLVLMTPTTTKSFDAFVGLDLDSNLSTPPDFLIATSRNSQGVITSKAVISNPVSQQWDFQSFGVWETGVDTNTGTLGVMSVGAPSPADAIPGANGATFTGKVVGSYVNSAGQGHTVVADLSVDFSLTRQSLSFSTTNTRISSNGVDFGAEITSLNLPKADLSNPNLNTLAYVGTNNFTGTLTTSGGLSGESSGQFYGPVAEELGGVFFLKAGSGVESYRGAYGASRL